MIVSRYGLESMNFQWCGVSASIRKQNDLNKNPAAVALGRLGGLKGGPARAAALSREERSRIAQVAAKARWKPMALYCPFCQKNNDIEVEEIDENEYAVLCNDCSVCGPIADTENTAIRRWNGITIKDKA